MWAQTPKPLKATNTISGLRCKSTKSNLKIRIHWLYQYCRLSMKSVRNPPQQMTSSLSSHEPATTASNHPRAPARTKSLRLIWPRIPCQPSFRPLPAASTPTTSRCNYRAQPPTATSQIIRTCSTIYKTHRLPRGAASFKSLYLKRPFTVPQGTPFSSGASDTALRLVETHRRKAPDSSGVDCSGVRRIFYQKWRSTDSYSRSLASHAKHCISR